MVVRSIPAWAGETTPLTAAFMPARVYPRVGGGNNPANRSAAKPEGLSPRGRGKPQDITQVQTQDRSIPAWAGETLGNASRPLI